LFYWKTYINAYLKGGENKKKGSRLVTNISRPSSSSSLILHPTLSGGRRRRRRSKRLDRQLILMGNFLIYKWTRR
jgi:hypothetical protein